MPHHREPVAQRRARRGFDARQRRRNGQAYRFTGREIDHAVVSALVLVVVNEKAIGDQRHARTPPRSARRWPREIARRSPSRARSGTRSAQNLRI
jgi:hypothetical protein